jgi:hypothetical protein
MKTDKELLELAAKAAGYRLEWDGDPAKWQPMYYEGKTYHSFDPLTDDGDALRLAVKLRLQLIHMDSEVEKDGITVKTPILHIDSTAGSIYQYLDNDPLGATRRAIVRAAAEIGEKL